MIDAVSHEDSREWMGCRRFKVDPMTMAPVGE